MCDFNKVALIPSHLYLIICLCSSQIHKTYAPLVKQVNLTHALATCQYCRRCFYFYQQGFMALLGEEEGDLRLDPDAEVEVLPSPKAPPPPQPSLWIASRGSAHVANEDAQQPHTYTDEEGTASEAEKTLASPAAAAASPPVNDYIDCRDVVLFSRILRMLDASSNSLRQQLVNDESE